MSSVVDETSLITDYNKYFSEVEPKNDFLFNIDLREYDEIGEVYDTNMKILLTLLKAIYKSRGLNELSENGLLFYEFSLFIYSLRNTIDIYLNISATISTITNIETLANTSNNCSHTILTHENTRLNNFFVKVVKYGANRFENDLVIFDVINGIYFNYLINIYSGERRRINQFISLYVCSFLSYYYEESKDILKWDYKKLCYLAENDYMKRPSDGIYSPYNPDSNNKDFNKLYNDNFTTSKYKRSFVLIYKSINHITLLKLITTIPLNISILESIFTENFKIFFLKLIKLGIIDGFHHNDLHGANIIYSYDINKLLIIDFGRSCFVKLLHEENNYINKVLVNEIENLTYDYLNPLFEKIKSYKQLYLEANNLLYEYNYVQHRTYKDNITYPMIVFDHITFILTMYNYLTKYFTELKKMHEYKEKIEEFISNFNIICKYSDIYFNFFNVNSNSINIDLLLNKYNKLNTEYLNKLDEENILYKYKTTFKILLDGLLLVALLLICFSKTVRNDNSIIYSSNHVLLPLQQKNFFISFLIRTYELKNGIFVNNNHFINYIFAANTKGINFDLNPYTVPPLEPLPLVSGGKKTKKTNNKRKNNNMKAGSIEFQNSKSTDLFDPMTSTPPLITKEAEPVIVEEKDEDDEDEEVKEEASKDILFECYKDTYEEIEKIKLLLHKEEKEEKKELTLLFPIKDIYDIDSIDINQEEEQEEQEEEKLGGKKKVVNRKIRRLKKYN